jgi:hypothetical protein
MTTELRLQTEVLPGHRIEVSAPELPVGDAVEVIVRFRERHPTVGGGILDFLQSLPPGPRSYPTWEEFERSFQEERDAWER